METHPNILAPPQPKKSRSSGPTANGDFIMDPSMYSTPMAHNPHMQQNPAVNAGGSAGGVGMNPVGYHGGGAGPYSANHPQQYPANHAPHSQMPASMYRTDMYGRVTQPMAHTGAPGNMQSAAYDSRSDAMYSNVYMQRRYGSGPVAYPPANAVVAHPRADGYPQGGGSMHSGQFMYPHSQMPPSSMNYSIATSGDPTPTQPTLQSSSGQQAALTTAGSQASTAGGMPGAAYPGHNTPAAPASSAVNSNSGLPMVDNSWANMSQPPPTGSAPSTAASSSAPPGAVNQSEVPSSSLANSAPPSSVAAETMNSVNQTVPTSSTPSPAPQPGSVPQRTPIQQVVTQVTPSPTPPSLAVNQVTSVSNIAGASGPPMPVGGAQGPPASTGGAGDGFLPQGTQQQPGFVRLQGSALRNDGDLSMPQILQGNDGIPQRAGIDDRLPPSSSTNPSAPGGGSTANPDQEKTKLIQQQLVLLLHAHKCLQRERESENYRCNLPHCQVMKEVFRHIMRCQRTRDCSYPHCASSRQIIQHWRSCGRRDCSICMPVKGVIKPVNAPSGAVGSVVPAGVGGPVPVTIAGPVQPSASLPMPSHPSTMGQPPAPGEQWQNSVRQDVRDHLIKKILNGIYPVNDYNSAMNNPQYSRLVQFIRRLEDNFFRTCTSKDEYFAKLADKYQQIVKDLQRTSPPAGMNHIAQPNPRLLYGPGQWPTDTQPQGQRLALPMSVPSNPGSVPNIRSVDSGLPPSTSSRSPLDTLGPLPSVPTPTNIDSIPNISVGPADLKSPVTSQPADVSVKQEVDGSLAESKPSVEANRRPSITSPTTGNDVNAHPQPVAAETVDKVQTLPLTSPTPQIPPQTVKTPTSATPTAKVVPNPSLKKVFTKEELESALRPVFNHMWEQPDAWPFQEPVNPERLNIPDYFAIVKEPMDLGTIDRKLSNGEYNNPWEFCKDFWLMIDNAWLYNRKTSKVYKMCSKLFEVFNDEIDGAMRSLGYCCGMKYTYSPQVLYCYSKNLCPIPRDASYFGCDSRYLFCTKCFLEIPGDSVSIGDDGYNSTVIDKSKFQELKNDHVEQELMIDCIHCCRTFHKACVLWHENIWPEGYQCNNCLAALGTQRKDNKYAARKLPTTQLGAHLEKRINSFLQTSGSGAGEITIRVVSSSIKSIETKPGMREKYAGEFPAEMPYRTKAMFVFEEIDGVDVCFFGMHVQEYSSDCPAPNTRRVYISYLDSVHFFQPREYRTLVYHEIIIGYMEFVKKQGFSTAHIWACPPSEGDDYIFHCHPTEQKIPKPKRLVEWYRAMLDRGKDQGVVHSYTDFYEYCQKEELTSPDQLPYFEGDFWPNVIEEQIKELDHELEEERKAEAEEADVHNSKKGASKRSSTNKKGNSKKAGKSKQVKKVGDLSQRIFSIMDKHREVFFVVQLHEPSVVLPESTIDPDPLLTCDLMEGRDAFLTLAREKHWEFSSLRRARYSTLAMLVALHTQGGDRFLYTCNMCQQPVETRYHCTECEDFDLCVSCYEKNGHEHTMTRLGMDLDIPVEGAGPKDPKEALSRAIQHFIQVLVHAAQCRDRNCKSQSCAKMKRIMHHVGRCKQCGVCKQFLQLCLQHAKSCKSSNCPVPLCANLKKHLLDKQRQASYQESRFAARRMLAMRSAMPTASTSLSSSSNSNGGAAVPSPAPSTPVRQQPSTPTPKAQPLQQQVSNSPAPSPAVRNPSSVPPPSVSHQSPGGKALGTLQQNQEAQQSHGPPSIPSKPIMGAAPSPHPATPVSYHQPLSVGPPSVGPPQGREQIMALRRNPQQTMETLTHSYAIGQPQPQAVRQVLQGQTVPTRYPAQMASNPQPYPSTHPHSGYMDGSTISSPYRYPTGPQRVAPHPGYPQPQPGSHMYLQNQGAYGPPSMTNQQMYSRDGMMVHSTHPARYSSVGGAVMQGSYHPAMQQQQQQQQQILQRPQQMGVAASNMSAMGGGVGMSVHPQQHQQRYQGVAPGAPPIGGGYQQQQQPQQQLYPPNAMPPQQPQGALHHGEPTLNPGYQGQFQPGYSNVERLDQVANQL